LCVVEHFTEDLEAALQFVQSFWSWHEVATIATFMNFDARDVDLPTREQEGVSGGAALEDATATLLAGTGLGHGDSVR
jgi:hypothetical protein